jgi:DNA invertase Pin-like site-specific DNA recombinase
MKPNQIPFSPGDHVIAYLRDSGHEKQEASVAQQESELRQFCVTNGLILDEAYKDEERQGSSDETRVRLAEMMHDLRHGLPVEGVLVWSSSRFARNSIHAQFYRAEIRKLGYTFHSITGQNIEGPESIIFEALDDYKNERYLADLSIDVKRGLRSLVRDHGCVPGAAPTGFKREQVLIGNHRDGKPRLAHKWIPDEDVAPRVLQAFQMRASGSSLAEINAATRLFGSINSFRTFFCNKIYLGILTFGDDLVLPEYCEPMVDKPTWDAVQVIQGNYTRYKNLPGGSPLHPRRVSSNYLLSGLVHCARCGSPLFGRSHPQKNGSKNISYYCTQAYNKRNCTKQRIPARAVEASILSALKIAYLTPEILAIARNKIIALNAEKQAEQKVQRRKLTAELAETRRQITNLTSAIAENGHTRAMLNRMNDLELKETEFQNMIAEFDAKFQNEVPDFEPDVARGLIELLDNYFPKADIQTQRRILSGMVSRVDVDRDGRRIFGVITVFYPPSDASAPTGSPGGGGYVRMRTEPSGPPRYTHIIELSASISGLSGRYKIPYS